MQNANEYRPCISTLGLWYPYLNRYLDSKSYFWVVHCGAWDYKYKYFQLNKKLEGEFPRQLGISGKVTPQATLFFEVMVEETKDT